MPTYRQPPVWVRNRFANQKTARIAKHVRSNGYAQSLAKEQSDLDWLQRSLEYMEKATPEIAQKMCDQHGLSKRELRELIQIQECRVMVSLRSNVDHVKMNDFFVEVRRAFEQKTKL